MRNLPLLLLAAFALPSCRPASDQAATGETMAEQGAVGGEPTGKSGDPVLREAENAAIPANIDEGVEPQNRTAALPTMIPDQFHGRWGINANDCKPERASDAKGLMVVNDSRLTFYESKGTLDRIDSNSPPNVFVANYGFSGEGMSWERVIRLERKGNKLRRTEEGGEQGPVDLTYTYCVG